MTGRLAIPLLLASLVGAGCSIDLEGLRPPEPATEDAGEPPQCPPGTVDANGDPDDGCEYACAPTSPSEELCDGMDNDCDPATEDGAGDPGVGVECDGADEDRCLEGTSVCVGGRVVCDDPTGNSRETCNDEDDDCDGSIDEDSDDALDWHLDRDADGYGGDGDVVTQCQAPEGYSDVPGDCDDLDMTVNPGAEEICNTVDEDCDGVIDDAPGGCDCVGEVFDATTYLFCRTLRAWTDARDDCAGRSGHLVVIDDATENDWVGERANHYSTEAWWIGLHDRGSEGSYEWIDGSAYSYTNWSDGEPNNGAGSWGGNEDCVELNRFSTVGTWNDLDCPTDNFYICEL